MSTGGVGGVAVVLATYQGERYLPAQLDSIAAQTLQPTEVVVTDDGSTDRTLSLIADFAASASFAVRLLRRRQERPARLNRKRAVTENFVRGVEAVGDVPFIAFADQDDIWHPDKLACLAALLEARPERSFALSDAELIDHSGKPFGRRLRDRWPLPPAWNAMGSEAQLHFALHHPFATGATMLVRSGLVRAALPVPPGWLHDRWFSIVGSAAGGSVSSSAILTRYRLHDGQLWGLGEVSAWRLTAAWGLPLKLLKLRDVQERLADLELPISVRRMAQLRSVVRSTVVTDDP